jgi:hypothetical protein
MVDMTHGSNVHVRLVPLELCLAHSFLFAPEVFRVELMVLVAAIGLEPMTFRL